MSSLPVMLLWHFHQPLYHLPSETTFRLPWVRLHTLREYHDMAAVLENHPDVPLTVNWTPVLLQQIDEYTRGYKDTMQNLRDEDAESLDPKQSYELLSSAFKAHASTMIEPYPRFHELQQKWSRARDESTPEQVIRSWTTRELRDVQVWSTLAWFGFSVVREYPEIKELRDKGQHFKESDKEHLQEIESELLESCIPRWQSIHQNSPIEISTTPYYHPILPLVSDYGNVLEAMPHAPMPERRIQWPGDVRWHLRSAQTFTRDRFDVDSMGLWPSEGSLSDDVMELITEEDFAWVATDEALLRGALTGKRDGGLSDGELYRAYSWKDRCPVFFRDHDLSDRIGFEYSKQSTQQALDDFFGYLKGVQNQTSPDTPGRVCSVVLDGENPWEYFDDAGESFLNGLYERLQSASYLKPVTPRPFLSTNRDLPEISRMPAGSWINGDFSIWSGHSLDVRAWELLAETREALSGWEELSGEKREKCWETLYAAQGSDWFWWYGDPFQSAEDEIFDRLFREMLIQIYEIGGHPEPAYLHHPMQTTEAPGYDPPRNFIQPTIDGRDSHYREWWGAARITHRMEMGTMARSSEQFRSMRLGSNLETIFGRIDFETEPPGSILIRLFLNGSSFLIGPLEEESGLLRRADDESEVPGSRWCYDRILEWSVPMEASELQPGEYSGFRVELLKEGTVFDRFPFHDALDIPILDQEAEAREWTV